MNEKVREAMKLAVHMVEESQILSEVSHSHGPNGIQCGFCMNEECITEVGELYWHAEDCDYRRFQLLAEEVLR